ncbi:hypothetical protein [Eisenibacter elegans]|jgi:tetratricopeptide (TPR) repeat protein|uniref:hypothetical protein n=1 Tax=Eisenibacter elegans TaxID=997 RepID=UPI000416D36B|nr:hypothetical protein [Eisenibacter elegans]
MNLRLITCVFLVVLLQTPAWAQLSNCRRIDSLSRVLLIVKNNDTLVINTYNALAEAYAATNNNSVAALYAQKALQTAQKVNYQKGIADAIVYVGLFSTNDLAGAEKVIKEYQKALSIYREIGDKAKVIELLEIIGSYYYRLGGDKGYNQALNYYKEELQQRKAVARDTAKIVEAYERLAELYSYLEQDDKALDALAAADQLSQQYDQNKINNARLLAKYQRIKNLEQSVQSANIIRVIVVFSIVLVLMAGYILWLVRERRRAHRALQKAGITLESTSIFKIGQFD